MRSDSKKVAKRYADVVRGMGTVLEIAPSPSRSMNIGGAFYIKRADSGRAIYRAWSKVGNHLITASGAKLIERRSTADARKS